MQRSFIKYILPMRLERLLSITMMLINRRKVTAPDLAEHFAVSVRTIYRDIEAIQAAGIPVTSYQGHEGGFCVMDNYRISRQILTFEDIVSILATLKGINSSLGNHDLDEAIEKIGCLIPEGKEEEFNRRSEQIAFDIVPWGSGERQQEHFRVLHRAITDQRLVTFTYTNFQSASASRTVEPMTLLFKSYSWYLFGYCQLRGDYRLFKLSRMRTLVLTHDTFIRKNRSYRDVVALTAAAAQKPPLTLELQFSAQALVKVEDFFEPDQITVQSDGSLKVKVLFPDDDWIYPWLLSYGDEVEVIAPDHVREKLLATVKKIEKKYVT